MDKDLKDYYLKHADKLSLAAALVIVADQVMDVFRARESTELDARLKEMEDRISAADDKAAKASMAQGLRRG